MTWWLRAGHQHIRSNSCLLAIVFCAHAPVSASVQGTLNPYRIVRSETIEQEGPAHKSQRWPPSNKVGIAAEVASVSSTGDIQLRHSTSREDPPLRQTAASLSREMGGDDGNSSVNSSSNTTGNATADPQPFVCADEGQICSCSGTAVYGKKFAFGYPGAGKMTNQEEIMGNHHRAIVDQYHTMCTAEAFGGVDPDPGYTKYCYCFDGDTYHAEPPTTTTHVWAHGFGRL